MALIDHAPEITDESEFAARFGNYRMFLHILWWTVGGIALTLILLAALFG